MDWITFTSKLIGQVISWPVAALVIAILYRGPISQRILQIRRIKTKNFEADFGELLKKADADVQASTNSASKKIDQPIPEISRKEFRKILIEQMPNAAILESWLNIERSLEFYFSTKGMETPKSSNEITAYLDYDSNFPPQLYSAYRELKELRNRAVHGKEKVRPADALKFEEIANRFTFALMEATAGI
nr:hypothetical protein 4 [Gammaproteobacteria bacterium]